MQAGDTMNRKIVLRTLTSFTTATLLLLAGCQTGEVYVSRSLHARIVDSSTGSPIEGAAVEMRSSEAPAVRQTTRSDKNGLVDLPRLVGRMKIAFPFVADRGSVAPTIVRVEAQGYVAKELNSWVDEAQFDGTEPVKMVSSTSRP